MGTFGGGGGTFARRSLAAASIGATETVTIGTGGTAGGGSWSGEDGQSGSVLIEELIEF
jgi:hypothetical protein